MHGDPGLGKTLMAEAFIEESGLNTYVLCRNKDSSDFIKEITTIFKKAKKTAPSIVFPDDMDKFANEDSDHCDAKEYVAVQAGIGEVKDNGVFILATVNDIYKLPNSLTRMGRFATRTDAVKIIRHYLAGKKGSDTLNMEDLANIICYRSCA